MLFSNVTDIKSLYRCCYKHKMFIQMLLQMSNVVCRKKKIRGKKKSQFDSIINLSDFWTWESNANCWISYFYVFITAYALYCVKSVNAYLNLTTEKPYENGK